MVVLVANAVLGYMDHPERHRGYTFSSMEHGFAEGGVQIDQLVRLGLARFGIGAFYRLGAYQFADPMDNLALKLTLGLGM